MQTPTPNPDIKKIWCDVYSYKCPICSKVLKSLSEKQLETNINEHNRRHQQI